MHRLLRLRAGFLSLLVFSALVGVLVRTGSATLAQTGPDQGSVWRRFELSGSDLQAVDAADANTVWAVGTDGLLARWDGSAWTAYDNSKLGAHAFTGVDVLSANAAWAVARRNVVARWDGSAWTAEASNTGMADMKDISMLSPTDGWIAGGTTADVPIVARYNGSGWQMVSNNGISRPLFGIDAVDSTNVWAVGGRFGPQYAGEIVRWTGTGWSQVLTLSSILYAVDMLDPTYGWAVGSSSALWQWNGTSWTQFPPPSPGATIYDVLVKSRTDAWAVGSGGTLLWHWDGASWTAQQATQTVELVGIDMVSPSEGWAVGPRSTIYRWNGTTWTLFSSRWTTGSYAAVDFLTPDDGWAVGASDPSVPIYGLQHWNGTTWEGFHPPVSQHLLTDVDMVESDAVWALGVDGYIFGWDGTTWTLDQGPGFWVYALSMLSPTDGWAVGANGGIAHFDGVSWTSYPSPTGSHLWSIDMVDAGEGWAGGIGFLLHFQNGVWTVVQPGISNSVDDIHMLSRSEGWAVGGGGLILHYSNGTWVQQTGAISTALLQSVHMVSPTQGWAVGANGSIFGPAIVLRYLNGFWSQVVQPTDLPLRGVSALGAGEAWIVGDAPGVLLHYQGDPAATSTPSAAVTATASPSPQPTTPTPTASPSLPTATTPATTTPTQEPCTITFSDVPPTDPFHTFIRCLACRGVLGGYSDGTFRSYNSITRGQISKVVSNAAGFAEPVTGQTYADMPLSNPFYEWIERLTVRGIMSGYPCGVVGEPCDPQNRPYFRWGANTTRGQLSKIVSNAAGFTEPASGQTFADVPSSNPFYNEIQRLANRGIMGGYNCGGAGEPCDPQNRPYFRWAANVTRGQASKIVANTFFPGCTVPW